MPKELIKKICHRKCYVFDTIWDVGDIYEGKEDPGKHFSDDGMGNPEPPKIAADDPRSTAEMRDILKNKYGVTMRKNQLRKVVWAKLHEMELAAAQDVQTEELPPAPAVKKTQGPKRGRR